MRECGEVSCILPTDSVGAGGRGLGSVMTKYTPKIFTITTTLSTTGKLNNAHGNNIFTTKEGGNNTNIIYATGKLNNV